MAFARTFLGTIVCLLAGCSSPGMLVTRAGNGIPPAMGEAPADGNYGLFIAGQNEPMFHLPLKKGDKLGFETSETVAENDSKIIFLYAVAKGELVRLDLRQTHEWRKL